MSSNEHMVGLSERFFCSSTSMLMFFVCYLWISMLNYSMSLKFQTSSNATQFNDLENLIGSLHTNAPRASRLFVHDRGLTNGQRNLLQRYENIRFSSSNQRSSQDIVHIKVDEELIRINNTLFHRFNQGKHSFISLIRKRFSLAIVIPFIESQRNRISTHRIYPACHHRYHSIDLIFYSAQNNSTPLNYSNQCYANLYSISADLSVDENQYPLGSAIMWKKLLLGSNSLRTRGYTHMFLMEPDTRPIRAYWLDALVEQITYGHHQDSYFVTKWWMMGSIYRGSIPMGNRYLHINGNALYHLTDDFLQFLEKIYLDYRYHSIQSSAYDLDMFLYLFRHVNQAKIVWHRFQFTDFIQNCWHSGCNDADREFIHNNPSTYLVHGYEIPAVNLQDASKSTCWLLLLFALLLVIFIRLLLSRSKFPRRHSFFRLYY